MPKVKKTGLAVVGPRTVEIMDAVGRVEESAREAVKAAAARGARADQQGGRAGNRAQVKERGARDRWADLSRVVVVNALQKGGARPGRISDLIRTARESLPGRSVVAVLDERDPTAVRAALEAGASEFLGRDELKNTDAVLWRLHNAVAKEAVPSTPDAARSDSAEGLRPLTVGPGTPLAEEQRHRAESAIEFAIAAMPTAAERRSGGASLLEIVAPDLRDPDTGRLDAKRIASAMHLSLSAVARAVGVKQQALSATPDSAGAQAGLLPIARLSEMLDEMFEPEHKRVWLQTPHARFGGRSPARAIEEGDAGLVVLSVERALEGLPD